MKVELHKKAIIDFEFWRNSGDNAIQNKIQQLITAIKKTLTEVLVNPNN